MKKIIENIFSLPTDKLIVYTLLVVLCPFVLISFFNNPATDDFYLVNLSFKYGLIDVHFWHYNHWSGRYFANGILFFSPLYIGNFFLYKIIPLVLLVLFTFSVKYFISTLFSFLSKIQIWSISSLLIILFLIQAPEVCSAFYWLPAAMTYQVAISLTLLLIAFYVKFTQTKKVIYALLTIVFIVFSMGCNEITTILNSLLIGLYFIYQLWKTKKINVTLLFLVAIAAVFACIELFAPGNAERNEFIEVEGKFNLANSLFKSVVHSVLVLLKWSPLLLLFLLLKIKTVYTIINKIEQNLIHPKWIFIIVFGLLFISLFPSFYIQNNIIADRSLNVIYSYFLFFSLYGLLATLHFLKVKYHFEIELHSSTKKALLCMIFIFIISDSPVTQAYEDLLNGKAYMYNNQMKERFKMIENSKEKELKVPALTKKPETIYKDLFMGLTPNSENWKNQDISEFYEKTVTVIPSEIEIIE